MEISVRMVVGTWYSMPLLSEWRVGFSVFPASQNIIFFFNSWGESLREHQLVILVKVWEGEFSSTLFVQTKSKKDIFSFFWPSTQLSRPPGASLALTGYVCPACVRYEDELYDALRLPPIKHHSSNLLLWKERQARSTANTIAVCIASIVHLNNSRSYWERTRV